MSNKSYTKDEIIGQCDAALKNIGQFYNSSIAKRSRNSKAKDTNEFTTEIVAEFVLKHIADFKSIKPINRTRPYRNEHKGGFTTNVIFEDNIAKALYNKSQKGLLDFGYIGKIIDYQVPLKNGSKKNIDLLAYNESTNTLRILELKLRENEETMLRCVLEAYTYLRSVNHSRLKEEYGLPQDTKLLACPFVFINGSQYEEMKEGRPMLEKLIASLDGMEEPYYIAYDYMSDDKKFEE